MKKVKFKRLQALLLTFVMCFGFLSPSLSSVKAEETAPNIKFGVEQSPTTLYPGQKQKITVTLPNYKDEAVEIAVMDVTFDLEGMDAFEYVENSAVALSDLFEVYYKPNMKKISTY